MKKSQILNPNDKINSMKTEWNALILSKKIDFLNWISAMKKNTKMILFQRSVNKFYSTTSRH